MKTVEKKTNKKKKKMAKKDKYTPDQLWDSCETTTDIHCTKCNENANTYGDESMASEDFFDKG